MCTCLCACDCEGKECGTDGCGGICGECGNGQVCGQGACGAWPSTCQDDNDDPLDGCHDGKPSPLRLDGPWYHMYHSDLALAAVASGRIVGLWHAYEEACDGEHQDDDTMEWCISEGDATSVNGFSQWPQEQPALFLLAEGADWSGEDAPRPNSAELALLSDGTIVGAWDTPYGCGYSVLAPDQNGSAGDAWHPGEPADYCTGVLSTGTQVLFWGRDEAKAMLRGQWWTPAAGAVGEAFDLLEVPGCEDWCYPAMAYAGLGEDRIVAAWRRKSPEPGAIVARAGDLTGEWTSAEIELASVVSDMYPAVARLTDGRVAVSWRTKDNLSDPELISVRCLDSEGSTVGDGFQVETNDKEPGRWAVAGIGNGDLVLVWFGMVGDETLLLAERRTCAGDVVWGPTPVGLKGEAVAYSVAAASLPGGGFGLLWQSLADCALPESGCTPNSEHDDLHSLLVRLFDAEGKPIGIP